MKRLLLISVTAGLVMAGAGWAAFKHFNSPVSDKKAPVTIDIPSGLSTARIAGMLAEKRLIRSKLLFVLMAKASGKSDKLKAGEYEIDPFNSSSTILARIVEGRSVLHKVTVPEGLTIVQIAKLIAEKGFADERSLIEAASDPELLSAWGIPGKNAEGYLMPETYNFRKDLPADEIIGKMVSLFFQKVEPLIEKYHAGSGLKLHEVVTLASIIEKEAAGPQEFPLVSAVFHNRLRLKMPLQADPTVIYALPNYDGNIHKQDLGIDSPYNTYKYRGLPPGPIANPGLGAIEAAFAPEKIGYLYFVAMGNGKGHHFSKTLKEHNLAVKKYILDQR